MPDTNVYTGTQERVYPAYLAVAEDGSVQTLEGTPGGDPVVIRRAAGNTELPEVPDDGLWSPVSPPANAPVDKPTDAPADKADEPSDEPSDAAPRAAKSRKAATR